MKLLDDNCKSVNGTPSLATDIISIWKSRRKRRNLFAFVYSNPIASFSNTFHVLCNSARFQFLFNDNHKTRLLTDSVCTGYFWS